MEESMASRIILIHNPESLFPLPTDLRKGLYGLTTLGFTSFFTCVSLQLLLTWRLIQWGIRGKRPNQYFILICNLIFADIQQSIAFILNTSWLVENGIITGTSNCWAQGWFLSTGDLASGVFCFCIGLHTFASVCFNYRLSTPYFMLTILLSWTFIYALAIIGVAMHPDDIYVRAVAWCWMNSRYHRLRLWLHYFWIFVFEFGTVMLYILTYVTVKCRIKNNFYTADSSQAKHARSVAKLMIVYPIVYVICTLPLATLRMVSMTTSKNIGFGWFAFAGAMITSNGWLDVLLYAFTRRIMLFSDEPPADTSGLESNFTIPFSGGASKRFGTKTICEYDRGSAGRSRILTRYGKNMAKDTSEKERMDQLASFHSTDDLFRGTPRHASLQTQSFEPSLSETPASSFKVKARTTIEVRSDPLTELADLREAQIIRDNGNELTRDSLSRPISKKSSLDFATRPVGWP